MNKACRHALAKMRRSLAYEIHKVRKRRGHVVKRANGTGPLARRFPKYDRNAPCPCGSGQKFKRCHGWEAAQQKADEGVFSLVFELQKKQKEKKATNV